MLSKSLFWMMGLLALLGLVGCGTAEQPAEQVEAPAPPESVEPESPAPVMARAVLEPTEGSDVRGEVVFEETPDGVRVMAEVTGLEPGKHGFHIHENGDCSAPDATSAGGHFNPFNVEHGGPNSDVHHVGDLGNLEANEEGVARYDATYGFLSLDIGDANSILDKAVIVHAQEDDLTSQPTGAAGGRLTCGVIRMQ